LEKSRGREELKGKLFSVKSGILNRRELLDISFQAKREAASRSSAGKTIVQYYEDLDTELGISLLEESSVWS